MVNTGLSGAIGSLGYGFLVTKERERQTALGDSTANTSLQLAHTNRVTICHIAISLVLLAKYLTVFSLGHGIAQGARALSDSLRFRNLVIFIE